MSMIRQTSSTKGKLTKNFTLGLNKNVKSQNAQPTVIDFISKYDYVGALTLLEFQLKCREGDTKENLLWIGYCAFHLGNFKRAIEAYTEILNLHNGDPILHVFIGCCLYYDQQYAEAEKEAEKGPDHPLTTRLLFHIAQKLGNEKKLMDYHNKLHEVKEDLLSLAAMHCLRSHYQEVSFFFLYFTFF